MTAFDSAGSELQGQRVLVISSDPDDRHRIRAYLESWGADTVVAYSAVRAFHALIAAVDEELPYSAVIVDQGPLGMSSDLLARTVKSDAALQLTRMIHIGAGSQGNIGERLHQAGYETVLPTPLDKTRLFDALHRSGHQSPQDERVIRLIDRYRGRPSHPPLSILLAEKDQAEKQRIRHFLQQAGHQVFLVDNGARVLGALENHRFDLAIACSELGEISGLDAFKLHRFAHPRRPWTPFILLLENNDNETIQACLDVGVGAILQKPVPMDRLQDAIEASLHRRRRASPAQQETTLVPPLSDHARIVNVNGLALDGRRLQELAHLGKGEHFLDHLLENFRQDTVHTLERLRQALGSHDWSRFCDLGHAIKDSAGCLGALELYQMGQRVTRIQRSDFAESAGGLLEKLECCIEDSYLALQQYLTNRDKFVIRHE